MASLAPAANEPDSSRVLTVTVSENNILLAGPEALNSTNIYNRLGVVRAGVHKVGQATLRDLILFVNADGTLSLEGETLTNILASSASYAMNGFKFLKRGKIAEELPESEIAKYVVDFPPGLLADPVLELPQQTNSVPPEMTELFDINIPEAMERLQSALQSADAKIILGENATAMLDILGVDDDVAPSSALEKYDIVKKDHTYSLLSSSQSSDSPPVDDWKSTPSPRKDSGDSSGVSGGSNSVGQKANAKVTKVMIGTLDDIVGLSKSCVEHKERAKTLVAQLPSIPPQLLGGSPVKTPAVTKTRSSITEAMLDEKFRQELLDNDDYGPGSGGSSEADVKRYSFSPDKTPYTARSLDSSFNSISPLKEVSKPLASPPRKTPLIKVKKTPPKRGKTSKVLESKVLTIEAKKRTNVVEKTISPKSVAKPVDSQPEISTEKKPAETKAAAAKKHYPKRENRRPPGRLQDALQPALFSTPDVIRRFSSDIKSDEKEVDIPVTELKQEDEESPPKVATPQNRVPEVDAASPLDDLASLPGPTEPPKKAKEAVESPKQESVTKTPQKEDPQEDPSVTPEKPPAETEPKVSKRIRKRKVVFSESDDSPVPTRKPKKSPIGLTKKPANTKPVKLKQSKPPRQSLEPSSGDDKDGEDDDDNSSNASWNSEDDPDRLWCICKKPHNNRFMICCDSCLEWFHGHCVGVTKAQGKQMEDAGQEWTCPSCKKNKLKSPAKTPAKTPVKAMKRPSTSPSGNVSTSKKPKSDSKKADKQSQDLRSVH